MNYDSCKASLVKYRIKPVKMSVESELNVCGSCHCDVFHSSVMLIPEAALEILR